MPEYQSSVYVWGSTARDALGCCPDNRHGVVRIQTSPRRLAECCSAILAGDGSSHAIRVVASFSGSGRERTTVITDKFESYSWGAGGAFRGGNHNAPRQTKSGGGSSRCTIERIRAENVTNIAHGTEHSCALTSRGEVYGWGTNAYGMLGVDPDNRPVGSSSSICDYNVRSRPWITSASFNVGARMRIANLNPRKLHLGGEEADVVAVACGEKHTCILRRDGSIITAGANDAGQLGVGSANREDGMIEETHYNGFRVIRRGVRKGIAASVAFKELSCGNNHCAAISSIDASLFTWGWGQSGRLGHGDEMQRDQPTYVEGLSELAPLATVACGSAHTLVATDDGDVYGFGWNAHGQVSGEAKDYNKVGPSSDICLLPVICLNQKGVVALSCGGFHSAAISQSGNVFMWGMNEDGQCGVGHEMPIKCPSMVTFQDTGLQRYAVSISCGRSHTVCVISNFLPLEVEALIDRLKKKSLPLDTPASNDILGDKREPNVNNQVIQTSEPDPLPVLAVTTTAMGDLQLDDSSTSLSHTSSLNDLCNANHEEPSPQKEGEILKDGVMTDESARRLIEMQKMNDEDHRSAAFMTRSRTLRQLALHAERLVEEKAKSEVEQKRMHSEDVLSREVRIHVDIGNGMKRPTKPTKKFSIVRDDLIDKAANRMKLIRERRVREAMAKKILPLVHRRPVKIKVHKVVPRVVIKDNEKNEAKLAGLDRRRELIKRRELRLKTKEDEERRAALLWEKLKDAEQQRQNQEQRQARLCLEELIKREENTKKMRLMKEMAELKRMEDDLNRNCRTRLPRFDENKENNCIFCSYSWWSKRALG
ncbi:hypothetical protein ACHAXA_011499 [Cyclostephanos tholiformis]|uniref:RCC1-like domain-containing protein n=1 Tax=Cyclostephanos tholiformis TaxID=382380 RepID=A0ABD3SDX8_9STRA